ncbi:MAG: hypothetical protein FWC95_00265 [Defluviitaleaceae bacterium]|nr:hypothetical protein [Defluviitaleaceae bacterium]
MKIVEALKNNLDGEELKNALSFVDYMVSNGFTPKMEWDNGCRFVKDGKSPCLLVNIQGDGEWFLCDVPVITEPEWNLLENSLKQFIVENIKVCSVHKGDKCSCGNEPGTTKKIFGKYYDNVCSSEIQFINPTSDVLDRFREIVEWWLTNKE